MEKPKLIPILSGMLFLWVGIMILIVVLLMTLFPPHENGLIPESLSLTFYMAIFIIAYVDASRYLIVKNLEIDEAKLENKEKNFWSAIAIFFQYIDLVQILVGGIITIAISIFGLYSIRGIFGDSLVFSPQFFVVSGSFVGYIFFRILFSKSLKSVFTSFGKKALPKYKLQNSGLIIDLNWKNPLTSSRKYLININFDEIDEIRILTFFEAQAFLKYEIGPNLELLARQTKDISSYLKGQIDKPSVYTITALSSVGKTVFLRGQNLFYFLTFDADDVTDLVSAFNSYKQGNR